MCTETTGLLTAPSTELLLDAPTQTVYLDIVKEFEASSADRATDFQQQVQAVWSLGVAVTIDLLVDIWNVCQVSQYELEVAA